VVKVIWHKAASPIVFARWSQCALPWECRWPCPGMSFQLIITPFAWRIQYMLPWAPRESITQTSSCSFQLFLHRWRKVSPYATMGRPFTSKLPFPWAGSGLRLIHGSLGPPESWTQTTSRLVQPFLHSSVVCQTDRQTYRSRYSVGNNRPHLRT